MAHARNSIRIGRMTLLLFVTTLYAAAQATDTTPPTAALGSAPDVNNSNAASFSLVYTFTVVYTDDVAIDVTTLNNSNIQVTRPDGSILPATFVSANPAVNAATVTATYQLAPVGGAVNAGADGSYVLALLTAQVKDTSNNAALPVTLGTVSINIFIFTSAPTATPAVVDAGQTVQFTSAAAANGNVAYAWDFADGLTGSGASIGHVFVNPGVYPVKLTATDAHGQALAVTVNVVVNPAGPQAPQGPNPNTPNPLVPIQPGAPAPPPLIANPNGDDDGDGYTNDVEQALGSDPESASSTPFNLPAHPQSGGVLTIRKLAVFLDFVHPNDDQIYLTVTAPAGDFSPDQQIVIVNTGHVVRAFKLSAVGKAFNSLLPGGQNGPGSETLTLNFGKTNRTFIMKLTSGAFQSRFLAEPSPDFDLSNVQGASRTRQVAVTVYMNGVVYQATTKQGYNARTGRFGRK